MSVTDYGTGQFESDPSGDPAVTATSDTGVGVYAQSTSGTGMHAVGGGASPSPPPLSPPSAILAEGGPGFGIIATSTADANGILAESNSGAAVNGASNSGPGVVGYSSSGPGVHAHSDSTNGVYAESGSGTGVYATSYTGTGVFGAQTSLTGDDKTGGVFGSSLATGGNGVIGEANNGYNAYGVWGVSTDGYAGFFEGNVHVKGNFEATGTKNFVQAHPTDPSREIVYVALEGGEAGTYMRGTGQLVNGKAVVALPEHFALVTDHQDLTIQLTPRGTWLQLYVVELDTAQFVVREAQGQSGAFDYLIHGIRRGYAQHEVIRTKR
jgi:hypothetical protein